MIVLSTDWPVVHPVRAWDDEEGTKRSPADQQTDLRGPDRRDHASQPMHPCERCGNALDVAQERRA